jgi:hypothetical protein
MAEQVSAYDYLALLDDYNLGSLAAPIRRLLDEGFEGRDLDLKLREDPVYQNRFKANQARLTAGLPRLSPLEYLQAERQYKAIADFYEIPEASYRTGEGGFDKFLELAVSPKEFEERVLIAQDRLNEVMPEVGTTFREMFPEVSTGDLLGYVLNPKDTLREIQKKVTAAQITASAQRAGLIGREQKDIRDFAQRARELEQLGVTGEKAMAGYEEIAQNLPQAQRLSSIYKEQPFTLAEAEAAEFGTTGSAAAKRRQQRLAQQEVSAFSGASGMAQGALARERAGQL